MLKGVGGWSEGEEGWEGRELTEGYKYLGRPDDHSVSQLETDGRALAGHLATLTPWRPPITNTGGPSPLTSHFDDDGVRSQIFSTKHFAYKIISARGAYCA